MRVSTHRHGNSHRTKLDIFPSTPKLHPRPAHIRSTPLKPAASAKALDLFSPAKINVFLRVVRRRDDGYHDLASLFHVIDLGDDMHFSLLPSGTSKDRLSCNVADVPTDESNLVIKALNLFRNKTGASERFDVDLFKRVPHGAGMGGGSGNAATTLWAANELCGRPATSQQLLEWSGDIGSDISVFFSSGAAYCTGRFVLFFGFFVCVLVFVFVSYHLLP